MRESSFVRVRGWGRTRNISCRSCPIPMVSRMLSSVGGGLGRMVRARSIHFERRLLPCGSLVGAIVVVEGRGLHRGQWLSWYEYEYEIW